MNFSNLFNVNCEAIFQLMIITLDVCFLETERQFTLITGIEPGIVGTRGQLDSTASFTFNHEDTVSTNFLVPGQNVVFT